jgi:hypothetical protein
MISPILTGSMDTNLKASKQAQGIDTLLFMYLPAQVETSGIAEYLSY